MMAAIQVRTRTLVSGVLIALLALSTTPAASAKPVTPRPAAITVGSVIATGTAEPLAVSLETTSPVIATGDPLAFTVRVSTTEEVSQVTTRLRIYRPTGRLIYQRTRPEPALQPGQATYSFERETSDLALRPGAYPVKVTVRATHEGEVSEAELEAELLVYDPDDSPVTTVVIARVTGLPLSGPDGRFTSDPARYTKARDDVADISRFVIEDPRVKLTLAVNPLLLEEWRHISLGYELAGPEGVEQIPATSATSQAFGAALERLRTAVATGRLELTSLGYSDPDLSELAAQGLLGDVAPQYVRGASALRASLETTPSTGTVPAGLCVPAEAVASLRSADVSYCVVSSECVRLKGKSAPSGSYSIAGAKMTALVTEADAQLGTDQLAAVERALFARHASTSRQPVAFVADIRPGAASAAAFERDVKAFLGRGWTTLGTAAEAAGAPRGTATLLKGEPEGSSPDGYWHAVGEARGWAGALSAAISPEAPETLEAARDALVAESSAWAGADGEWLLAERGRDFADRAISLGRSLLDPIALTVRPVTLAGTKGAIPASITNGTEVPVTVVVELTPEQGLSVTGKKRFEIVLQPQENFFEIPVDLQNAISGRLRVKVLAGDMVLDEIAVTVQASYLDRLAIVGGILVFLGVLLAFIIKRARAAEAHDDGPVLGDETNEGESN